LSKTVTNISTSIRQRLLNLARTRNEDFGLLLTKYALERILYRISQSKYRTVFVLKGVLLFELWTEQAHRPTRDADSLSQGENDPARLEATFKEVCTTSVADDGMVFDPEGITAQRIKEDADYEGVRVSFLGFLEKARIPMQIDIGFGDAITPHAVKSTFPAMLNGPAPVLLTYPKETVVAEKFEAMVKLGMANSRMKDFHDIRTLGDLFPSRVKFFLTLSSGRSKGERLHYPLQSVQSHSRPSSSKMKKRSVNGAHLLQRTDFTQLLYRWKKSSRPSSASSCQ